MTQNVHRKFRCFQEGVGVRVFQRDLVAVRAEQYADGFADVDVESAEVGFH